MSIHFIPINYHHLDDCALIAQWFNDPEINYLITPNASPHSPLPITAKYISEVNLHSPFEKYAYFIVYNNTIVGDVNIIDNPSYLLNKQGNSCWLGITIAYKQFQGLGIGKQAMNFIESLAKDLGFVRIELGVFSFNERAIAFYKKLNYQPIGKIPRITYYNGEWHDDLRFEKYLT